MFFSRIINSSVPVNRTTVNTGNTYEIINCNIRAINRLLITGKFKFWHARGH